MFYTYKSVDLTTKCDDPNRSLRVGNISHSRVPLPAFIHMHTCTYFWLTVKTRCIYSDNTHLICVIRRWQCFVFFLWNGLLVKKKKQNKIVTCICILAVLLGDTVFLDRNLKLGTLDFTGSEHLTPFHFP